MNKEIVGTKVNPVIFNSYLLYISFLWLPLSPGVLACLDGYMNIALEQTEEYVNGQLKNKYGDAFIRGNNGSIPSLYSWTASEYGFLFIIGITSGRFYISGLQHDQLFFSCFVEFGD